MLVTVSAIIGALIGALFARKRNGATLDIVQHAAIFAILFAIVALFVNVAIVRMM